MYTVIHFIIKCNRPMTIPFHVSRDFLLFFSYLRPFHSWPANQAYLFYFRRTCLCCLSWEVINCGSFQVMADPRFRLQERLREAGLQDSRFAREAIANMKPLHAPRKDMESNVFQ